MEWESIYEFYAEELAARQNGGFGSLSGHLAIEDTAYFLDISIHEVCKAISYCEHKQKKQA
jgi:hypothetical protein